MQMNAAEASELFGLDGITNVSVEVADGANVADVQAAIAAALPAVSVVDHATVLDETTSEFTANIDVVGNVLLGFGFVALFVSIFIIYNTFAIVLGQRTRELALLRAVGADPRQIRRSVLGEAFVVGVLASVGGIGGGILVAKLLEALFSAMGADLPDYPLVLATRTLVAAIVIGVGVTMLAAIGPARRAATVPPIAALSAGVEVRRCRFSHPQDQRLRPDRRRCHRRRRRPVRYRLDGHHDHLDRLRCNRHLPRRHIAQPAGRRCRHHRARLADAQAQRRHRSPRPAERRPQLAPHRHHGCRADDRTGTRVDRTRRRRVDQVHARHDLRRGRQGRLLPHRPIGRRRLSRQSGERHPRVGRGHRRNGIHSAPGQGRRHRERRGRTRLRPNRFTARPRSAGRLVRHERGEPRGRVGRRGQSNRCFGR